MNILIIGSGMMGQAIAFDLINFSNFENITLIDNYQESIDNAKRFLKNNFLNFPRVNIENKIKIKDLFKKNDIAISAVPYNYNYYLAKISVETKTDFLDLGGNNEIVKKEKSLSEVAKKNNVTIIPDCGLAPGMTSVITKDIFEKINSIEYVKIRVGGLPVNPKPPFNYQIVFSPNGLINEYIEDAIVLDNGKIVQKKSMGEIEKIIFPEPFTNMEAFTTSGGCSTLPYTYKDKIGYLDYKTVRYPGHCEKFKPLLKIQREKLVSYLLKNFPANEKDVVLLKVFSKGVKDNKEVKLNYSMVDFYDDKNKITSMMRTTAYPTAIIAQMIVKNLITKKGVYCPEEIVPCKLFFNELKKRDIIINKEFK